MRISDWSSDVCSSDLLAVIALGGGRRRVEDRIDPAVGVDDILPLGTVVSKSDPIAMVHAADEASAEAAAVLLQKAFESGQTAGEPQAVETGSAWGRAGVCQTVWISVVCVSLKKKNHDDRR